MLNLSRFTRLTWGKIWLGRFAPCKRFDISQLWGIVAVHGTCLGVQVHMVVQGGIVGVQGACMGVQVHMVVVTIGSAWVSVVFGDSTPLLVLLPLSDICWFRLVDKNSYITYNLLDIACWRSGSWPEWCLCWGSGWAASLRSSRPRRWSGWCSCWGRPSGRGCLSQSPESRQMLRLKHAACHIWFDNDWWWFWCWSTFLE